MCSQEQKACWGKGLLIQCFQEMYCQDHAGKTMQIGLSVMGLWVSLVIIILNFDLIPLCSISNELFLKSAQGWWMAS